MTAMWCNQQRPLGAATGWRLQLGFHHGFPGSPPLSSAPPHQDPFQGRQAVGRGDNHGRVTLLCWLVIRRRQKIEGTRGGVSPASRTSCSWCWCPWVIEKITCSTSFSLFLFFSRSIWPNNNGGWWYVIYLLTGCLPGFKYLNVVVTDHVPLVTGHLSEHNEKVEVSPFFSSSVRHAPVRVCVQASNTTLFAITIFNEQLWTVTIHNSITFCTFTYPFSFFLSMTGSIDTTSI